MTDEARDLSKLTEEELKQHLLSSDVLSEEQAQMVMQAVHQRSEWSAPLPPPVILQEYEQILPGGAERVFAMTELEQKHRHQFEDKDINLGTKLKLRGQGAAIVLIVLSFFAAFAAQWLFENPWFAAGFMAPAVFGIIAKFIKF